MPIHRIFKPEEKCDIVGQNVIWRVLQLFEVKKGLDSSTRKVGAVWKQEAWESVQFTRWIRTVIREVLQWILEIIRSKNAFNKCCNESNDELDYFEAHKRTTDSASWMERNLKGTKVGVPSNGTFSKG